MAKEQVMTPEEIVTYIHSQAQWNEEEKWAVWSLYESYISTLFIPRGSDLEKRGEDFKNQLLGFGIKV